MARMKRVITRLPDDDFDLVARRADELNMKRAVLLRRIVRDALRDAEYVESLRSAVLGPLLPFDAAAACVGGRRRMSREVKLSVAVADTAAATEGGRPIASGR